MKLLFTLLAAGVLASPLFALESGEVSAVAKKFSDASPDAQYQARVELNALINQATAPGKSDSAAVTKTLLAVLASADTPVEAKKYILRALANIGTTDAIPALATMLAGSDALLREEARLALEFISDPKAISALEGALTNSTDNREKIGLANSLAVQKASSAVAALSFMAVDSDPELARAGITALARIGGPEGTAALRRAYTSPKVSADLKPEVERALLLASNGDTAIAKPIFDASKTPAVKVAAFEILTAGELNDARAAVIQSAFRSDDPVLRKAALRRGLELNVASLQNGLAQSMSQFPVEDRVVVLSSIHCLKSADIAEKIALASTESTEAAESAAAFDALGKMKTKSAFQAVLKGVSSRDKQIANAAGSALATMAYPATDADLLGMLKGDSSEDKLIALKAVTVRQVDGVNAALLDIVKSDDEAAGKEALKALYPIATIEDLGALTAAAKAATDPAKKKLLTSVCTKIAERLGTDEAKNLVKQLQ